MSEEGGSAHQAGEGLDGRIGRYRLMVWDVAAMRYRSLCLLFGRSGLVGYRMADDDSPASIYDRFEDALADVKAEGWIDDVVIGDDLGNVIWKKDGSSG